MMTRGWMSSVALAAVAMVSIGCGGATPEPATPAPTAATPPTAAPPSTPSPATAATAPSAPPPAPPQAAAAPKAPLDANRIAELTGGKPQTSGDVVKVSFPRDDVKVDVDGWRKMPPFMGVTSWAAFVPGEKPGVETMVMGDLVVFEDEVNPVMSAALDNGLEVTALHNHFFFDKPHVYFMHIGGEGALDQLGKGVKAALDAQRAVRHKAPHPAASFGAPLPVGPSKIDAAKLDAVFGLKGQSKDGMYKATMGRKAQAGCGCTIGKAMGVNT